MQLSLKMVTASLVAAPMYARAAATPTVPLSFYNAHTRERLDIHHQPGTCLPRDVHQSLNYFLRDFRTGDIHPIDFKLLDMIGRIQQLNQNSGVVEVISGYRSPKTNRALRRVTSGVAKKSLHMKGRAIDIRINGLETTRLRDTAVELRAGGVGYYASSNFVHLDSGDIRSW